MQLDIKGNINCPCCGATPEGSALWFLKSLARAFMEEFGRELIVSSGMRCPTHNKAVGGLENSAHTKGLAFDVVFGNSQECFVITKHLIASGVCRIGLNQAKQFIHFDVESGQPQNVFFKY